MAGLTAANRLVQNGHKVIILEARNRIGGRIWTDRSLSVPIDLGASWIHKVDGNPVGDLARRMKIKTALSDRQKIELHDDRGNLINEGVCNQIFSKGKQILKEAREYGWDQRQDLAYKKAIEIITKKHELTKEELNYLQWYISAEEMNEGIEFDKLSARGDDHKEYRGCDVLFPEGFDQILNAFDKKLNIKYNQLVKSITYDKKEVQVKTATNSVIADYCLVTVPLGVLKQGKIDFHPPLPPKKLDTIHRHGFGLMNKIAIQFPEVFWPKEKHFIGYVSKHLGEFPVFVNMAHYTDQPYLLATTGGRFARKLEAYSDAELKDLVQTLFQKMYPGSPQPKAIKFSRWMHDPFSYGSYSYIPEGETGKNADTLAQPVGRLHFAGEATMRHYQGTVHGAYLSGERAAQFILED